MNSTLESSGLSKRKSSKKFSSMGSSWANWACARSRMIEECIPRKRGQSKIKIIVTPLLEQRQEPKWRAEQHQYNNAIIMRQVKSLYSRRWTIEANAPRGRLFLDMIGPISPCMRNERCWSVYTSRMSIFPSWLSS